MKIGIAGTGAHGQRHSGASHWSWSQGHGLEPHTGEDQSCGRRRRDRRCHAARAGHGGIDGVRIPARVSGRAIA